MANNLVHTYSRTPVISRLSGTFWRIFGFWDYFVDSWHFRCSGTSLARFGPWDFLSSWIFGFLNFGISGILQALEFGTLDFWAKIFAYSGPGSALRTVTKYVTPVQFISEYCKR